MGHGQKGWARPGTSPKGIREVGRLALDAPAILLPLILH